ncbi:MAG: TonB-dependent receptor [Pseudomonadota bacterium]|nr:TonB-dependent receptor [Pseudomonadota bacterium]
MIVLAAMPSWAQTADVETAKAETEQERKADTAAQLPTMTIIGEREALPRVSGSAHVIDEAELARYGYDDVNRILNAVPGVYVREEDGFGLRPNIGLRGGSADRSQKVTLLEDGVLLGPAPYSAPAAYFFPLMARMVGVEVFKGPAAISQGPQTVGGAINFLTAPIPEQNELKMELAGGTDAYRRFHARAGGQLGGFGVLADVVHVGSDGFKDLDGGGDTGFEKNEALFKLSRNFGVGVLEARLGYATEQSDETYLGLTEADFRAKPTRRYLASALDHFDWDWNGQRVDWKQGLFGGSFVATAYSHQFDRAWRKFNNLGGGNIRDVLGNPETPSNSLLYGVITGARDSDPNFEGDDLRIGTNDRQFRSSGIQARQNWSFSAYGEHRLEVGMRLHSDRVHRFHDELAYEVLSGDLVRNALPRAITTDNIGRTLALASWIRDEITLGDWTLAPGVRVEQIAWEFSDRRANLEREDDYAVVLPGLGVNYAITPQLNVLAGVHKGFSPATVGPSPSVEPEEAINYEAGGRLNTAFGRVELIGFYSDYSNLTAACTFSSGCSELDTQTNAGRAVISGIEAGYEHTLPVSAAIQMPLAVTYTYTASEFREAFSSTDPQFGDVEPGFELPYVPAHRLNLRLGLDGSNWSSGLSVTYQSQMRDSAGEGSIEPGTGSDSFTVVDLSGRWNVNRNWAMTARADNVLDREYIVSRRPFGARPGRPAAILLGVEYSL